MEKKKVLIWDRGYSFKFMKSVKFDILMVCLQSKNKKMEQSLGYNVIACFEEEYANLPIADIPDNYLDHSLDSDRFLKKFSYEKRLEILGKEISFWRNILDKYNPDCFLNEVVTVEFIEVLYIEARKRGIPYFAPNPTFLIPLTNWLYNPYNSRVPREFVDKVKVTTEDLSKAKEYVYKARRSYQKPSYVRNLKSGIFHQIMINGREFLSAWKNSLSMRIKGHFFYEDYTTINKLILQGTLNRFFYKHDKPDFSRKDVEYILYPLHFEPEACVEYFGYRHNNQATLIGDIAHSLSANQVLVVKEHPQQVGILLTEQFRTIRQRHSNLMYISGEVSSFDISKHISCLITLNGTIGFEYWLRNKPVYVLGDVFYTEYPGFTFCKTIEELREKIRRHIYDEVTDEQIIEYTAKMFASLFEMNIDINASEKDIKVLTKHVEYMLDKGWKNKE